MAKFRKRPVVIDAVRWDGSAATANRFIGDRYETDWEYAVTPKSLSILIPTLEGVMACNVGDWIIKGVAGEFYPCRDAIFQATYEAENP